MDDHLLPPRPARLPDIARVVREMQDRGTIWLMTDPLTLQESLALVDPFLAAALRFEEAVLLNRVFIDADLNMSETDIIFRVPFAPPGETSVEGVYVFILGEHYSERPRNLAIRRIVHLMDQIWMGEEREMERQQLPPGQWKYAPVVPIVLSFGRSPWSQSLELADHCRVPQLRGHMPTIRVLVLDTRAADRNRFADTPSIAAQVLSVIAAAHGSSDDYGKALARALARLRELAAGSIDRCRRALWFLTQLTYQRRPVNDNREFVPLIVQTARSLSPDIGEEVEMVFKTASEVDRDHWIHVGEERGIQIGEERGIQIGASQGLRSALIQVLEGRFGPLSASQKSGVLTADLDRVSAWLAQAGQVAAIGELGLDNPA